MQEKQLSKVLMTRSRRTGQSSLMTLPRLLIQMPIQMSCQEPRLIKRYTWNSWTYGTLKWRRAKCLSTSSLRITRKLAAWWNQIKPLKSTWSRPSESSDRACLQVACKTWTEVNERLSILKIEAKSNCQIENLNLPVRSLAQPPQPIFQCKYFQMSQIYLSI